MSTESAIEHFRSLRAFQVSRHQLHSPQTFFSDTDSEYLVELPELRQLVLTGTAITDRSLRQIERLDNLDLLDLSETSISDAVAAILLHLPHLRTLGLYATRITNVTLDTIATLPRLQTLNVSDNPQITDVGFQKLAQLKHLKSVEIRGTSVSDAAVNAFSIQRPEVLIVTNRGHVRGVG